jgi:NitT/TauT family transport system ATP-binding protein
MNLAGDLMGGQNAVANYLATHVTASPDPKPQVVFENLSIGFTTGADVSSVVEDVSFCIEPGTTLALVGPSGCGKTSLLKALLGELAPRRGQVKIMHPQGGPPRRGAVFQDASVFPWMTAQKNIEFTLRLSGWKKATANEAAAEWLAKVGLDGFGHYYPLQLSGGMRQRVALARALAIEPEILALDEPFGQLDDITRTALNDLYAGLHGRRSPTALLVTHSIEEAVFLADRVVVLSDRPARVIGVLDIDLPQPRATSIRYTDAFTAYTRDVSELLGGGLPGTSRPSPAAPVTPKEVSE